MSAHRIPLFPLNRVQISIVTLDAGQSLLNSLYMPSIGDREGTEHNSIHRDKGRWSLSQLLPSPGFSPRNSRQSLRITAGT